MTSHNINYFKNYGTDSSYYWQSVGRDVATHFNHSLLVYGDYCSTGAVGRANVESILAMTELCERIGVIELHEAYNTTSIMFPIEALQDAELIELLHGLDNYPCLDDEAMSRIEHEMQDEAWESYGRREFDKYLESLGYDTNELSSDDLDSIWDEIRCMANYDIGHVEGDSWYFDFDSMDGILKDKLLAYLDERIK